MNPVVVAVLAASCAVMAWCRPRARRIVRVWPPARSSRGDPAVMGAAFVVVIGWIFAGVVGAFIAFAVSPLVVARLRALRSAASHRAGLSLARQVPVGIDLMAAALAAGSAPSAALRMVGEATEEPLGPELLALARRLDVASDGDAVWSKVPPGLEPVGRAFRRADSSGVSVVTLLAVAADECRRARRAQRRKVAASIGVRTAAPLGLCFLPAFFLTGIVPGLIGTAISSSPWP